VRQALLVIAALCGLACTVTPPRPGEAALDRLGLEALPLQRVARADDPSSRLEPSLRLEVFPGTRKDDPIALCVDLAVQPDYAALGSALDAAGLAREERAELFWEVLAAAEASRTPFLDWLGSRPGVREFEQFRGFGRVCFVGSERVALAAAAHEDVAYVLHVAPVPEAMPRSRAAPSDVAGERDRWAASALGVERVHAAGHRGAGVTVAVLDSGVSAEHPALAGRSAGLFQVRPPRGADLAHGSRVLAAAVGAGGLGVAPAAAWAAADPLPEDRRDPVVFARCIDWLLGEVHPDVVVAPWDLPPGTEWTGDMTLAFGALRTAGAAAVFPAGNTGPAPGENNAPAHLSALAPDGAPAFSVGGVDRDGAAYQLSNRGPSAFDGSAFPQVAAPAVGLAVLDLDESHAAVLADGTSFSSGYAAGVVAVLMGARPDLTGPEAEALLRASARDLGVPGHDPVFGHGLLDLPAALGLE
jgi:subtilisin family serine protease